MIAPTFNVGVYVLRSPASPRSLVKHGELLQAYADGSMAQKGEEREAYLSHFASGDAMQEHYKANRNSVAGFVGPCWCRWVVLDIDRDDLAEALADARRLVTSIHQNYPEAEGDVPIYFSGRRGFHILIELAHNPSPAVGFHHMARTFAETLAARAGVRIDTGIYDVAHIIRLPNTQHPRTGLFKRRIEWEALLQLDVPRILEVAKFPAGDGIPSARTCPAKLADDWLGAERLTAKNANARNASRLDVSTPALRAPRYYMDFVRFGVGEGDRHRTLFSCSAWLTEQGAPPSLCSALLTEPGRDVGLAPKDVERQIACGIRHVHRQQDPIADADAIERRVIRQVAGGQHDG